MSTEVLTKLAEDKVPSEIKFATKLLGALPEKSFEKSTSKALLLIGKTVLSLFVCYALLATLPAYFLPVTWILAGTAITGLFNIGHNCGHRAFFESDLLNQIVGSLAFLPLLYPLETWKMHHDLHHEHAQERSSGKHQQKPKKLKRLINPMFWVYDLGLYFLRYFDLEQFSITSENEETLKKMNRLRVSVLLVYAFAAIFFPVVIYNFGLWALVKYWLVPWFVLHFWKNTHRQNLMAVILDPKARKLIHYRYPFWVEFLSNDANYLVPHYLNSEIPGYNCKWAYYCLLSSRHGDMIEERSWLLLLQDPGVNTPNKQVISQVPSVQKGSQRISSFSFLELLRKINWLHTSLLTVTPLLAIYGFLTTPLNEKTIWWSILWYYCTGLGITAGYHRLWAHRAYSASLPVRIMLGFFGTGAVEGSIRWWCRDHRAHHRYTDTPKDPYSAKEGFLYAHVGWMVMKQDPKKIGRADISDLNQDALIRWQHRNYVWLAPLASFVFPMLVAGVGWGDWRGGLFFAGFARLVFVHHATFFVNSLAHTLGSHTFDDKHTPRDSWITALLTLGEGYHNFHHEFPQDYRNAIRFYQYDPTKWLIRFLAFFGLTYGLKMFPDNEVQKGAAQMQQKHLDSLKNSLDWGPEATSLPEYTMQFVKYCHKKQNKAWIVIDGFVHDVTDFLSNHPGGKAIIKAHLGTNATEAFNGVVYDHSNAARNLLTRMRIARLSEAEDDEPESETEVKLEETLPAL